MNAIVSMDGETHTISKESHVNYDKIIHAIKGNDWETVKELIDVENAMKTFTQGNLVIEDGEISWNGKPFHNALSARLMSLYEQGLEFEPLANFMENVMQNPSYRAVNELYSFLEKNDLPITPDGCFMAYKRVKKNDDGTLVDCYTRKIPNDVGKFVGMPRNEVDDNPNNTCSYGLHFCSLEYLQRSGYGGSTNPIVLVKINPKDVVSIPIDYNNQKGRCCGYTVSSLHEGTADDEAFDSVVYEEEVEVEQEIPDNVSPFTKPW